MNRRHLLGLIAVAGMAALPGLAQAEEGYGRKGESGDVGGEHRYDDHGGERRYDDHGSEHRYDNHGGERRYDAAGREHKLDFDE